MTLLPCLRWLVVTGVFALVVGDALEARADDNGPGVQVVDASPFKARLLANAALATRASSTLAKLAKQAPPRSARPDERAKWEEQSRFLQAASDRYARMKTKMDMVLARTNPSPSEMVQTNMEFGEVQSAVEAEAKKFASAKGAPGSRHAVALAAIKSDAR